MKYTTASTEEIEGLLKESVEFGDVEMQNICKRALRGIRWAIMACSKVLQLRREEALHENQ